MPWGRGPWRLGGSKLSGVRRGASWKVKKGVRLIGVWGFKGGEGAFHIADNAQVNEKVV